MSTQPERKSTKPRIRSQKIRLKGHRNLFKFGGWLSDRRRTYLRVEDLDTKKVDWIDGYALYRLSKAVVRRWEAR